jgi:hypothetical protein
VEYVYPFLAGFIATLTFHQGTLAALHKAGLWPKPAFSMARTGPIHVPAVLSLAFWGGVWGILLWLLIRDQVGIQYWFSAILFGAVAPSAVALFVVFPAKGMPVAGGWKPQVIGPVLVLNAAWGLGVALFMRVV